MPKRSYNGFGVQMKQVGVVAHGHDRRVVETQELCGERGGRLAAARPGGLCELAAQEIAAVEAGDCQKARFPLRIAQLAHSIDALIESHSDRISTTISRSSRAAVIRPAWASGAYSVNPARAFAASCDGL